MRRRKQIEYSYLRNTGYRHHFNLSLVIIPTWIWRRFRRSFYPREYLKGTFDTKSSNKYTLILGQVLMEHAGTSVSFENCDLYATYITAWAMTQYRSLDTLARSLPFNSSSVDICDFDPKRYPCIRLALVESDICPRSCAMAPSD